MRRSRTNRYLTIAGTFAFALAIGFVMQNGDVLASRLGVDTQGADPKQADDYTPVSVTGFVQPKVRIDPATGSVMEFEASPYTDLPDMMAPSSDDGASLGCDVDFEAIPAPAAMVTLALDAPCRPETLVTVQHQGMKFHAMTDAQGRMTIDVPALAKEAFFVATLSGSEGVVALTGVPDLNLYDRAVLQWRGDERLQLHANEFGADSGADGHVWAASTSAPSESAAGKNGFLTPLGVVQNAAPMMVQVYTFPTGMSAQDGDVVLSVQSEITATNCGRAIEAQSIQLRPNQPPAARRLTLRIPGCDRVGEILVLKNMFEDLTLAAK